jgi:hypothetical protein
MSDTLSEGQQQIASELQEIAGLLLPEWQPLTAQVFSKTKIDRYKSEFDGCLERLQRSSEVSPVHALTCIDCLLGIRSIQKFGSDAVDRVKATLDDVAVILLEKNKAYGNSALDPVRYFSKADAAEQIKVRIDDKLSRIMRGSAEAFNEDVVLDLIGYLVLLRVAISPRSSHAGR